MAKPSNSTGFTRRPSLAEQHKALIKAVGELPGEPVFLATMPNTHRRVLTETSIGDSIKRLGSGRKVAEILGVIRRQLDHHRKVDLGQDTSPEVKPAKGLPLAPKGEVKK